MTGKKTSSRAGHSSEKIKGKNRLLFQKKNGFMIDIIRLLSVWSPMITRDKTDPLPVIGHAFQATMDLTYDYNKLREIAFSHFPKGTDSGRDWLSFFKNQDACDKGRELVPPRFGKGEEFSTRLGLVNYQSTLKSLAKAKGLKTYAISLNLRANMVTNAKETGDATKSITEMLNYRFKIAFNNNVVPDYYFTSEFASVQNTKNGFTNGEKRLHYHGAILLDPKYYEKAKACFKQLNPDSRSLKLKEQSDILNFYPVRWGMYTSKDAKKTKLLINHPVYATRNLKAEAKHHYNVLRSVVMDYQSGKTIDTLKPADRLRELEKQFNENKRNLTHEETHNPETKS